MAEDAAGPPNAGAEPETGPDGEIVGGPRNMQQIAAQRRLMQTQAQVDEVVDIMKTNVEKVLDRDAKLSELDDRANALQQGASQFEQQAKSLKNKFWLQNLKVELLRVGRSLELSLRGQRPNSAYSECPSYKATDVKTLYANISMMIIMGVIGIVIIGLLFVRYRGTPTMSGVVAPTLTNATLPSPT